MDSAAAKARRLKVGSTFFHQDKLYRVTAQKKPRRLLSKLKQHPLAPKTRIASFTTAKTIKQCLMPLRIGKPLAKGFFGTVAEVCELSRKCDAYIVKIQNDVTAARREAGNMLALQKYQNEHLRPIQHFMPKFIRYCEYEGRSAIVMQRGGRSIYSKGSISGVQILQLIEHVANIHRAGFFHRDLKFNNVLERRVGGKSKSGIFIADFGLALLLSQNPEARLREIAEDQYALITSLWMNNIPLPPAYYKTIKHLDFNTLLTYIDKSRCARYAKQNTFPLVDMALQRRLARLITKQWPALLRDDKNQTFSVKRVYKIKYIGFRGI